MEIVRNIDKNIFREYDIRGVYGTSLNEDISYTIGFYYGNYIKKLNQTKCVIGHDNRVSSESINASLKEGIINAGVDVIDLGLITTPMLYFARTYLNINPGIMITASHNPKDDNGFKLSFDKEGNAKGKEIYEFRDFIYNNEFDKSIPGNYSMYDIKNAYYDLFLKTLSFGNRKIKVVLDPGNGVTSVYAKELYEKFPLEVVMINDENDGTFPNHHPDPSIKDNLKQLQEKVLETKSDIGIAFDGDGDRVGVILDNGKFISSDEYAILMLRYILNGDNKKALYDIKCSSIVKEEILKLGGIPYENRTGASYMMDAVIKNGVLFGVEYSGHIYFNSEFPPITSGMYAGLKLLEMLSKTNENISNMLTDINEYYKTDELKFPFKDEIKYKIIEKVYEYAKNKNYNILSIDGVKVYFSDGWALLRTSNTGPNITARFEAKTKERLDEIENEFLDVLLDITKK